MLLRGLTSKDKNLLMLGLPVVISNFFSPFIALTDAGVISLIPENGSKALAAVGLGSTLITGFFWLFGNVKSASYHFLF